MHRPVFEEYLLNGFREFIYVFACAQLARAQSGLHILMVGKSWPLNSHSLMHRSHHPLIYGTSEIFAALIRNTDPQELYCCQKDMPFRVLCAANWSCLQIIHLRLVPPKALGFLIAGSRSSTPVTSLSLCIAELNNELALNESEISDLSLTSTPYPVHWKNWIWVWEVHVMNSMWFIFHVSCIGQRAFAN